MIVPIGTYAASTNFHQPRDTTGDSSLCIAALKPDQPARTDIDSRSRGSYGGWPEEGCGSLVSRRLDQAHHWKTSVWPRALWRTAIGPQKHAVSAGHITTDGGVVIRSMHPFRPRPQRPASATRRLQARPSAKLWSVYGGTFARGRQRKLPAPTTRPLWSIGWIEPRAASFCFAPCLDGFPPMRECRRRCAEMPPGLSRRVRSPLPRRSFSCLATNITRRADWPRRIRPIPAMDRPSVHRPLAHEPVPDAPCRADGHNLTLYYGNDRWQSALDASLDQLSAVPAVRLPVPPHQRR